MVPTLLGIALAAFLLLESAPTGRVAPTGTGPPSAGAPTLGARNAAAVEALEVHYGLRDPATGEAYPVMVRFGLWLERLAHGRLAGPGQTEAAFRARILGALPATLWVGGLGLLLAVILAFSIGPLLGLAVGRRWERMVSSGLLMLDACPPIVTTSALAIVFAGGGILGGFPAGGLPEEGGLLSTVFHLALPVVSVAIAPAVVLARLLRTGVAEAAQRPPGDALVGWGADGPRLRRHLLRNGMGPCLTALGSILPMTVTGSLVVESVFGLHGIGKLVTDAVLRHEPAMVLALTLLVSTVTLVSLLLSDLAQRWRDPRERAQ